MSKTSIPNAPLPFDELAEAIKGRRSIYGLISGPRLDRAAPGEAWSNLPYRPVFVGDTETGVLHGGGGPPLHAPSRPRGGRRPRAGGASSAPPPPRPAQQY